MSENHYSHIPSPVYGHLGNDPNKQRNDYSGLPSSTNQLWSAGPPNEFGNRKEYMETQLTEENYNSCDLDSNANQNDVIDDEPYPPPGLRRLVTGQTVSFDDGPGSPPFDRVVPGEGNTFSNYPQPARMSKPVADPYPENIAISERYVSGSTTKEYSSLPHPTFMAQLPKKDSLNAYNNSMFAGAQPPKKDNINMSGNNSYYNADNTFNLSTQDFFDTYLHDGNSTHDENTSKPNQYSKKFPSLPGGFQNNEASKRETYFQPEKPINAPKPSQNNFNDDYNNENLNSPFSVNLQTRPNHLQPDGKVLKPSDNSQSTSIEKPLDVCTSIRRPSVENFTQEQPSSVAGYGIPYNQQVNSQNYDASFQTYECNSPEENNAHFNHTEQSVIRGNQDSFNNQEDGFGNRDVIKKDSVHHDGNFSDHRELANVTLEASLIVDSNKESNLKSPYRKSSIVGGEDRADYDGVSLERGKVPGAQSTPNDSQNQSIRSFPNANNSNYNNSNIFKTIEDDGERDENVQGTDSDEKSLGRRMVLGYNSNTIPGPRSGSRKMLPDSKVNTQYPFDSSFSKSNKIEPLEHRMVVGEGGNIPSKSKNPSGPRYSRDRKKQLYDRVEHHNVDSDDEDYEEFGDRTYDNSPDRESRSYHDKYYRNSPPHRNDKRSYRRTRDSFTQSQDESYFDDDDDDYDTYRNQRRYYARRYPREPVYKNYEHDPRYRDERYRDRRDYYSRYEDDPYYREPRNSRPSSRSGSEYRREFVDYVNPRYYNRPPYYEHLDHRYIVNYGGEPRLSKKEMDYWTKIREIDPQKYMNWFKVTFVQEYKDWYLKYVSTKMVQPGNTYQADRRGSGHSGQSSVNNDIIVNDDKSLDISREQSLFKPVESDLNMTQEIRCTPLKFSMPHAKGKFSSLNQLLVINPCSPRDGQRADIDFGRVLPLEQDVDYIELLKFSGPCVVGETHVNTVSNYLRDLINNASHPSEQLLYQLIDLIIKLRGVTDEVAISELLTDNYHKSQIANVMPSKEEMKLANNYQSLSEAELIEKFYYLYFQGNRNEALDLALSNQMWGQALIAGFTMGPKYHSRVLNEFFSIPVNSPLKTAYQFYSKQIPQIAMTCSDEKWSDWRIHLAVMLSYPTPDPEFNKQAIITLGDSLSHKDIFASHFCYLAAQADFGPLTKQSTKYTLLTQRNGVDNFDSYPPTRAILLTQTYEFAKRLQRKKFTIGSLLPYKLLLAVRLISYRNFSVALQYLESMALDIIENPNDYDQCEINDVVELSEKVKYSDAKFLNGPDSYDEKQWLIDLRRIANLDYNEGISHVPQSNEQSSHLEATSQYQDQSFSHHQQRQQQQHTLGQQPSYNQPQSFTPNEVQQPVFFNPSLPINQPMSLPPSFPPVNQQPPERRPSQPWESEFNSHEHMSNYPQQDPYKNVAPNNNEYLEPNDSSTQINNQFDQSDALNNEQQSYWDTPQQTITMPSKSKFTYFNSEEDKKPLTQDASQNIRENNQPPQPTNKNVDKNAKKENKNENHNNSWLGGIFGKLSLRPKNEMKLPDDKNPSIVWNEEKQRWVNVNGDDDDDVSKIPPPPMASGMQNIQPQMALNQLPRSSETPNMSQLHADPNKPPVQSSGTNMYKLSRGKGMKANYVNVLSQNTTPSNSVPAPGPAMDAYSKPQRPSNMNFFVPSSDGVPNNVSGDPGSSAKLPANSQVRNSNAEMPMFYNPAQYNS